MFSALRTNIAVFFTGRVLETIVFSAKSRIGSILCDELQAMRLGATIAFAVGTLSMIHCLSFQVSMSSLMRNDVRNHCSVSKTESGSPPTVTGLDFHL